MQVTALINKYQHMAHAHAGTSVRTLTGHAAGIQDLVLSPDESQVATASDDHTVRLFSLL